MADKVHAGDVFLCYVTGLKRWVGIFDIESECFDDHTPIFAERDDPFFIRFKVKPRFCLPLDEAVPIEDESLWPKLSFTRQHERGAGGWIGPLRRSLQRFTDEDAAAIVAALERQQRERRRFPLDDAEIRKHRKTLVHREDRTVEVTVPEDDDTAVASDVGQTATEPIRESMRMQALLAECGERMGFRIWIPAHDRGGVQANCQVPDGALLTQLPLNYDDTTLRTIAQIDVIWLKGRSIVRAFEVEHTTAIYSGILRMADLLALQPNMDIRLHIVAPEERRQKVFDEIRRPVFSLLERRPLSECCTFLSYDSIQTLAELEHLQHLSDSVIDEYAEEPE